MDTGREFLQAQVNNTIVQHESLVESLRDHAKQADDTRFRQLCERYVPKMESHQRELESYGKSIGAEGRSGIKGALGSVMNKAREAVDAMRETDFLRIVNDIVMMRQAQDTFATFAKAGQQLGDTRLAQLGQQGEREHDEMQREFNRLCAEMFVDHVNGTVQQQSSTG